MIKTRITEMLGIEYPIIAGGMYLLSTAELAAAVSEAGGLGIIASTNFTTAAGLREEIRRARGLTKKPLGVNVNLFLREAAPWPNDEFIDVILEERVEVVETSGVRTPEEYLPKLKQGNVKVIHKVTAVKHALSAERIGVDAVGVVGVENGGAVGMDNVTTMVIVPAVVDALKIPVLAGGGIADARGFLAALALGAEGIIMGTRFMATRECPAHQSFKDWMVKARETETVLVERSIRTTHRCLRNQMSDKIMEMEARGASLEELLPYIGGETKKVLFLNGDLEAGVALCGQNVGLVRDVPSVEQLIGDMIAGARAGHKRLADMGLGGT